MIKAVPFDKELLFILKAQINALNSLMRIPKMFFFII